MTQYWRRGYKDPQLQALYLALLQRTYVLYCNISRNHKSRHSAYHPRDWSLQIVREELESFVSEIAMLELEPEPRRTEKKKQVHRHHQDLLNQLFDTICFSDIWTDSQAEVMEEMLLSPTIDTIDQQLLVSALMLSLLNCFDMAKFRTLVHVFEKTDDQHVRQRTLIGWALSAGDALSTRLYPEKVTLVEHLLEDETCCQELVELQEQLVFCIATEEDNRKIQKEIMPDILKGNNFRVTRNGIEEVEEDALNDILHSDEWERKMEKAEESFNKMIDMQKQGSDIYFGGFSQMKRFPFFNVLSNWFIPFYVDHPDVAEYLEKMQNNRFVWSLFKNGPFCSSDKYSFLLGFGQVFDRFPQNLRDALNRGEIPEENLNKLDTNSVFFIRRTYLQDLYRFYRLYPRREEFYNPFDTDDCGFLFFADGIFSRTHLEPYFNEVVAFLIKKKRMFEAGEVLANCGVERRDFKFYMMAGYLVQHGHYHFEEEGLDDLTCYEKALQCEPDNERALLGCAHALFNRGRYEEALVYYERLLSMNPDKKAYLLNHAVCLVNLRRYADALKPLYRLNYESADDKNVNRVLAWALACGDKYEQAERIYTQLLSDNPSSDDLLNYGYFLWFSGHVDDAADCFHRYLKETGESASVILNHERELLREKGVTEPEMQMMLYLL